VALCVALSVAGAAGAAELSADAIVQKVNRRDEGRFARTRVSMDLIDKRGSTRSRVAIFFRMNEGDDRKLAVFYESPKTIRDTAFLTIDYAEPGREDDQWLYLPAMRRSRRIASADRGSSFLGTDLSYEEVKKGSRIAVEDYRFERSPEADGEVDGHACVAVRATPRDERTARELGYSKVVHCVDPEIWMVRRSEFWNRAGVRLKTVHVQDIREVDGVWTAHRIHVENHRKQHQTVFAFDEVAYPPELDADLFTERRLRQGWR
jgi:hypothetical protein